MATRPSSTPAEQAALVIGLALLATFGLSRTVGHPASSAPAPESVRLDPNTAPWFELLHVEGVGDTLARRIVEDRDRHGPYQSIEDLTRVRGIGEKSLSKMRPDLAIIGAEIRHAE